MSLFQTSIEIIHSDIAKIVSDKWNIKLGKVIKSSQNHTFEAYGLVNQKQTKYSVRVTPDPHKRYLQRISDQISFVNYLVQHKLNHICNPIPLTTNLKQFIFAENDLIVCVFQWANGKLLNFVEFQWMTNKQIVLEWGRFFAQLHAVSKIFQQQHPQTATRIQNWDSIHQAILKGTILHPDDESEVNNSQHFGVIHGDLNCSNFFWDQETKLLNVFDTDQVQRGFYLWDVSQAVFTTYMLEQAGMPISGTPVPQADRKLFQSWIIQGYEQVAGQGKVNLDRLERMVLLKRQFYVKFCNRAMQQGNIPVDMKPFIEYIANTLGKQN